MKTMPLSTLQRHVKCTYTITELFYKCDFVQGIQQVNYQNQNVVILLDWQKFTGKKVGQRKC